MVRFNRLRREIKALLKEGERIKAVKLCMDTKDVGLAEAYKFVKEVEGDQKP